MKFSVLQRAGIFLVLALVMLATRVNHFERLPDASWALFFLGGFYLRGDGVRAFPALMALAVLVDWLVIRASGLSFWAHYCVSAAYWFLLPSYLVLWLGGAMLRRGHDGVSLAAGGRLLAWFGLSVSACFLLSNGSFYWLSDVVPGRSLSGWLVNLGDWYLPYLYTAGMYTGLAAVLHMVVAALAGRRAARAPVGA